MFAPHPSIFIAGLLVIVTALALLICIVILAVKYRSRLRQKGYSRQVAAAPLIVLLAGGLFFLIDKRSRLDVAIDLRRPAAEVYRALTKVCFPDPKESRCSSSEHRLRANITFRDETSLSIQPDEIYWMKPSDELINLRVSTPYNARDAARLLDTHAATFSKVATDETRKRLANAKLWMATCCSTRDGHRETAVVTLRPDLSLNIAGENGKFLMLYVIEPTK